MLLDVEWSAESIAVEVRSRRIRTPYGSADVCLKVEKGRGALALLMHVTHASKFTHPERYSAPGLLLALIAQLPELGGDLPILKITPVLPEWNRQKVIERFEHAGFEASIVGDSLTLKAQGPPRLAIQNAALVAFSLDAFTRSIAEPELWSFARRLGGERSSDQELLRLLDERRGDSRLREMVGQGTAAAEDPELEKKIISALARTGTREVVQFHCRGPRLLRRIAEKNALTCVIGIDKSFARANRKRFGVRLVHGSLQDPPEDLPPTASALLIDALPPWGDLRVERAAEVLFRSIGFEWILCLEERPGLEQWGETVKSTFGYAVSKVGKIGTREAILFRRKEESVERIGLSRSAVDVVSMKVSETQWARTVESIASSTVDPRWLIYVPPSIATLQSENTSGDLEPPEMALDYYRVQGINKVVVEAKPIATRGVAIICRDEAVGHRRFGIASLGCVYTRRGRPFVPVQDSFLKMLRDALSRGAFWKRFETDWVCIEGDVLPWNLNTGKSSAEKPDELLRRGESMYAAAAGIFEKLGCQKTAPISNGQSCLRKYRAELERRWSLGDGPIGFAPVHLLATEGKSYFHQTNLWHMQTLGALSRRGGEPFVETPYQMLMLDDRSPGRACVQFRDVVCAAGAEGIVIKPLPFCAKGHRGQAQPGFLCRGGEQLRLVYGPEYDLPERRLKLNEREVLKHRRDRSRAIVRQLMLSMKALEHFLKRDPLREVEVCVRGALALEEELH